MSRLALTPLASVEPRPVGWLYALRVPLWEVTLLGGPEGVGKSTLLAWIAAEASRGTLPGDLAGRPIGVVIAALEDDTSRTLRPRLEAAGADLTRVSAVTMTRDGDGLRLPEHLAELVDQMTATGSELLIVDPVKSTAEANPDREGEVRALLGPIVAAAHKHNITVIVAAHFRKNAANEDRASWKIAGSAAWVQVPRSVLVFGEDPEAEDDPDARILAHAKSNLGRRSPSLQARVHGTDITTASGETISTSKLVVLGESAVRAEDVGQRADQHGAGADARAFLLAFLHDGKEHGRRDVLAAAAREGLSDSTINRERKSLGIVVRRHGTGADHRSTWALPSGEQSDDIYGKSGKSHQTPTLSTPSTLATHLPLATVDEQATADRALRLTNGETA